MIEKYGFVYLLSHPWMPGVYKVGCTERSPHQRALELSNSTSVPCEFTLLCYIEVKDPFAVEAQFHRWLGNARISKSREFFSGISLEWIAGLFYHYDNRLSFTPIDLYGEVSGDELIDPFKKPVEVIEAAEPAPKVGFEAFYEEEAF